MSEEMTRDPNVFILGEEVGAYQGAYKITQGLLQKFGEWRVRDTPIAEEAIAGVAVGAAFIGLRPIAEMMTFNFSLLALDMIVNHAAKYRYMSGGQIRCPMVMRGPSGAAAQVAAQHSQAFESWYVNVPGLVVVMPSTPKDAKGLLKSAIRDDNPVIFMENEVLYNMKGEVPDEEFHIPLGLSEVKREGDDVTIVAWSRSCMTSLEAARRLAEQGIEAEVVDPRTLRPLDDEPIFESVRKTGRCVVVEEGWPMAGFGAEISRPRAARVLRRPRRPGDPRQLRRRARCPTRRRWRRRTCPSPTRSSRPSSASCTFRPAPTPCPCPVRSTPPPVHVLVPVLVPVPVRSRTYGSANVTPRKTAICPLVTTLPGQKFPPPHPPAIPRAASSLTHGANALEHGTSPNTCVVQAGGT